MSSAVSVGGVSRPAAGSASPPPGLPDSAGVMGQAGDENFPVASRLLGRRTRGALLAIYGFARLVDEVGDEYGGDRRALLALLGAEGGRIYARADSPNPLVRPLAATACHFCIP